MTKNRNKSKKKVINSANQPLNINEIPVLSETNTEKIEKVEEPFDESKLVFNPPIDRNVKIFLYSDEALKLGCGDDNMYTNGEWDLIKKILDRGGIWVDVGANRGEYLMSMLAVTIPNMVFCFEPIPNNFQSLFERIHFRENVKGFPSAVGNITGTTKIYWYKNNPQMAEMSNLFTRPEVEAKLGLVKEELNVQIVSLDDFVYKFNEGKIDKINFCKADCEGSEFLVLQGAKRLLEEQKIDFFQFEKGGAWSDAKVKVKDVFKFISSVNYILFRILPEGLLYLGKWDDKFENFDHCNMLMMSKNKFDEMKIEGINGGVMIFGEEIKVEEVKVEKTQQTESTEQIN